MSLSTRHVDALSEIINIGIGRAASILNEMLESHVTLSVPDITAITGDGLYEYFSVMGQDELLSVSMRFLGFLQGSACLVFTSDSANKLVSALSSNEINPIEFDAFKTEAVNEVGNILLNGVMGSVSNTFDKSLSYTVPSHKVGSIENIIRSEFSATEALILAEVVFFVQDLHIEGAIILVLEEEALVTLLEAIDESQ